MKKQNLIVTILIIVLNSSYSYAANKAVTKEQLMNKYGIVVTKLMSITFHNKTCSPVPKAFKHKIGSSDPNDHLSDDEIKILFEDDYKSFAIYDTKRTPYRTHYFYDGNKNIVVSSDRDMEENTTIYSEEGRNFPIICGNPEVFSKAESDKFKAKADKIRKSRKKGIVYKSKHFWQNFALLDVMESTFNGDIKKGPKNISFKLFHNAFISNYDTNCNAYISSPKVSKRFVMDNVKSRGGIEESRDRIIDVTTQMEKRFSKKYDEYATAINSHNRLKGLSVALNYKSDNYNLKDAVLASPGRQVSKFIKFASCGSATMYQMKENLWRASQGKKSLQDDGVRIINSEKESVSAEDSIGQLTLYEACMDTPSPNEIYCQCFYNKALLVMKQNELKHYSMNYKDFYLEVEGGLIDDPKNPDLLRLLEARKSGLKCVSPKRRKR